MEVRRIIRWIWAVIGRLILYSVAIIIILNLVIRWQMDQRGRQWRGGGDGWRGNREPSHRTIPRINAEYDLSIKKQIENYPLHICVVDGNALDHFGHPVDYDHNSMVIRLCSEDCLRDFLGDP